MFTCLSVKSLRLTSSYYLAGICALFLENCAANILGRQRVRESRIGESDYACSVIYSRPILE